MQKYLKIENGKLVESSKQEAKVFVYIAPTEEERNYLINDLKIDVK